MNLFNYNGYLNKIIKTFKKLFFSAMLLSFNEEHFLFLNVKIWGGNTYLKGGSHEVRWELSQTAKWDHRGVTKIHKKHLHT